MTSSGRAGHEFTVVGRQERFRGPVFQVVTDRVVMPGGEVAERDCVLHIGAVGVVAVDEQDRVVLIRQYRHPVGRTLWELPAGLVDVTGEPAERTAARELAEETDLQAQTYQPLLDLHLSPGYSNEMIRLFLAHGLSPVPAADRHTREGEEADLEVRRVPLDEAVRMVLDREITNASCVAGVLAVAALPLGARAPITAADGVVG